MAFKTNHPWFYFLNIICGSIISYLGCSIPEVESDGEANLQAIVNGQDDFRHPAVGAVLYQSQSGCTATLIGRQTILTAAHCFYGFDFSAFSFRDDQQNLYPILSNTIAMPKEYWDYRACEKQSPECTPNNIFIHGAFDFAIARIQGDPGISPASISSQAPASDSVILITGVGFDKCTWSDAKNTYIADNPNSGGTKRYTSGVINMVYDTYFTINSNNSSLACPGDSGAPVLDQLQRIVGVNSRGVENKYNEEARLDFALTWIKTAANNDIVIDGKLASENINTNNTGNKPTDIAGEGQPCTDRPCGTGLACTDIYLGSQFSTKCCLTQCSIANDPICNKGESCTVSKSSGMVCFNANSPSTCYSSLP